MGGPVCASDRYASVPYHPAEVAFTPIVPLLKYSALTAKLAAALLRVAGVTAGLAGSNGSLPPGL